MTKYKKIYAADFETTVYHNQETTEVWSFSICELYTEDVKIYGSIDELFYIAENATENTLIYFHNLKFDGSFILDRIIRDSRYTPAYRTIDSDRVKWLDITKMNKFQYKYMISDKGIWYNIHLRNTNGKIVEFRDSLKLMPFSLEQLGKAFHTKHRKLEMEYKGYRHAHCKISDEEKKYIINDVLVLKECLEYMYNEDHKRLTIGSCCMSEFKGLYIREDYESFFPDLYKKYIDSNVYGEYSVGDYVRNSYRGAWTYLVKGKENRIFKNGSTYDCNSLYPSVMHSSSGNRYPVGYGCMWKGDYIPEKAIGDNKYYFIRVRTAFYLKKGMLPTIQIKGDWRYKPTEFLESSDIWSYTDKRYYSHIRNEDGSIERIKVTLTLTMTDWGIIKEHYDLVDCEILDGVWFFSEIGLFDSYIDKYMTIKEVSTGAKRAEAKLFLNNLYGKLATSTNSSFKLLYLDDNKDVKYKTVEEHDKIGGYIPCGSAVTSYARAFTIRAAQNNYFGSDKKGFIYADTDSIHIDLPQDQITGIPIHQTKLQYWKKETEWDEAIFVRAKTYIEHIVKEGEDAIQPYYNITCAGLPDRPKRLFQLSMDMRLCTEKEYKKLTSNERRFVLKKRTMKDFKRGIVIPSKLKPHRIKGGIILVEEDYTMR